MEAEGLHTVSSSSMQSVVTAPRRSTIPHSNNGTGNIVSSCDDHLVLELMFPYRRVSEGSIDGTAKGDMDESFP